MTINITFMRHGYSRADDEMVHEGRYDSPLTDKGRAQVRARADAWKRDGVSFDAIIASTLVRASETAQIVGETLDVPVELDRIWMERDNGPLAGMSFDEARERFNQPKYRNPYQPFVVSANAGEGDWDLYTRATLAVQRIIRRGTGSYLVVAHGGLLGGALYSILGIVPSGKGVNVSFEFGDTGYVETSYDPNEAQWSIRNMILSTPDEKDLNW